MSKCCSEEKLLDLVLNELTGDEADVIQAHAKECDDCRQLLADLKFSVSFFQNRLGDIPDMPKQLSQRHFKEIITTARELEAEQPNIWSKPVADEGPVATQSDDWGRAIAWSVAAAFAIAFGVALFVKQPWQAPAPHVVQDDPTSEPKQPLTPPPAPRLTPEPTPRGPVVADTPTQPTPTPTAPDTPITPKPQPKPEDVAATPKAEPKPEPVVVVAPQPETKPQPEVTPAPELPPPPPVVVKQPTLAEITIYSLARNQLPRHLKSTPGTPNDSGLAFTSTGYVRKISNIEAEKYLAPKGPATDLVDKRDLYELEYKTDGISAKHLIDISERIQMVGGASARSLRFKPRSQTLEIIGNRQELMAIHRTQEFLCDPSQYTLNLSSPLPDIPTKVKRGHTPFVVCFNGHAIAESRLKKAMPVALFARIKEAKKQEAERVKSNDEHPEIKKEKNEKDKTDKGNKSKRSLRPPRGRRSAKQLNRVYRKPGNDDEEPAPPAAPAPPPEQPEDPVIQDKVRQGLALWRGRNSEDDSGPVRVELTEKDFGGTSYQTIEKLKNVTLSKKLSYRKRDFSYIMKRLCSKANVPLIDISDQSEAELSLSLEHISLYDAIEFLCRRVNVKVLYTGEGVILTPAPHPDSLQTVLFKIDSIPLRLKLRKAKSVKAFLMDNGIKFPKGAGASATLDKKELIMHNSEAQLLNTIEILELRKWGE